VAGLGGAGQDWITDGTRRLPRVGSRVTDEVAVRLTLGGRNVLDLQAHPQRPLPPHVLEAVAEAAGENRTVPSRGLYKLRQAIADTLGAELGVAIDPDHEILVTAGAMQALDLSFRATVASDQPVLTPAPCFFLDGLVPRLITVTTSAASGYAIDWEALDRAVTGSTRVMLIVTPGNPTGYVLDSEDIVALSILAERHDLLVVCDESYDRLVYDGRRHLSPLMSPTLRERGVLIRSFTKSFAMPGWRVGYLVGPAVLIDACLKLLEWSALYGSSVPQAAALSALTGPQSWLEDVAA